jgi:prepilin-type N-terminal cleavage/methylation domain-containing protein
MTSKRQRRRGISLVEVLIVVAILAVLIALLLVGVINARRSANRTTSSNNLRQIGLALQMFIEQNQGELPALEGRFNRLPLELNPLFSVLPYIEEGIHYQAYRSKFEKPTQGGLNIYGPIKCLINPADPSRQENGLYSKSHTSYAANAMLFPAKQLRVNEVTDGLSNTIAYAERYSYRCNGYINAYDMGMSATTRVPVHPDLNLPGPTWVRRPTFADQEVKDVYPVRFPNETIPSTPGLTFQVAPRVADCDSSIPQTPHRAGMLAAMADGSVRVLAKGMAQATFWAGVTPNWDDALGPDW